MKKLFVFILIHLLSIGVNAQSKDVSLVVAGRKAYEAGKYETALSAYTRLANKGLQSYELYYNLGNTYFKLNDIPNAILYYERAKKLDNSDEDLLFNLQLANSKITDKVATLPQGKSFSALVQTFNTDTWAILSMLTFMLFLLMLFLFFYVPSLPLKRSFLMGFVICFIISIMSFFMGVKSKQVAESATEAIIFSPSVTVSSTPKIGGTQLFVIHEGLKVSLLEKSDKYLKIKLADGNVGWVPEEVLKKI